jgi:uncharacterized protein YcfJ
MVKRRHKPISKSEIVTIPDRQSQKKVGPQQRLPSTEGTDTSIVIGGVLGGRWASTEAKDTFAAAGHPELAGIWASAEAKDAFAALGGLLGGAWHSTEAADAFAAIGHPEYPTGAWHSTEGTDTSIVIGGVLGGRWASTEAKDTFAAAGHPELVEIVGEWVSIECPDYFTAAGPTYDFGEPIYTETIEIFGQLLEAQRRLNDGDPSPHGAHAPPTCASPQHRRRR